MSNVIDIKTTAAGLAALAICESLLIALGDLKIIGAQEAAGVLQDAAAAHLHAGGTGDEAALHREVAAIIGRIMAGGNAMPPP
jgi:hypothetical protein